MEIKQYLQPVLNWWPLILAACILAGVSSFIIVRQQPPTYKTQTTLVIGRAVYEPNPSPGELNIAAQLASYYANIVQRDVVRNATREALGLDSLPSYATNVIPSNQLIEIVVTDTDPKRAQVVANELAKQLINQTPSNPDLGETQHQEFVSQQLNLLESQITSTIDEIAKKENELGELNSAKQIADAQSELNALKQKLSTLQTNYAAFLGNSTGRALNSLTIIERAALPRNPIGPNLRMIMLMSVGVAFVVSTGAAYLIEYLDDTFKSQDEIAKILNLPVIGVIQKIGKNPETGIYVEQNPTSIAAEGFRLLKFNFDYIEVDKPNKMILISSATAWEGKTFMAVNLAYTLSQSGKRVVLLEADLRKPSVDRVLSLPRQKGLSDVIRGDYKLDDVINFIGAHKLMVITAGSLTPNPFDVLSSKKMETILSELRSKADVIIIDGPPIPVVDTRILAKKVDAILFVVRYGYARKGLTREIIQQVDRESTKFAGVIFNSIPNSSSSYYSYGYPVEKQSGEQADSKLMEITKKTPLLGKLLSKETRQTTSNRRNN